MKFWFIILLIWFMVSRFLISVPTAFLGFWFDIVYDCLMLFEIVLLRRKVLRLYS